MNRFNISVNFMNFFSIFTLFCFLSFIIIGGAVLWPKFQELKEINKNIGGKETEIKMEEDYFSELKQIKTDLEEYETELSKITSAIPDSPSVPAFFNFLQKISSESGLVLESLGSFSIGASTNFPVLRETVFGFNVTGSYSSFKNFLSVLEKSARLIEVENISFSSRIETESTSSKEKNLFAFSLRVKIYSY